MNYNIPMDGTDSIGPATTYSYCGVALTGFVPTGGNDAEVPSSTMLNTSVSCKGGLYEFGLFGTKLGKGTETVDVAKDGNGLQARDAITMA